jgi:arylsulfatase A-like enzyme
MSILTSQYPITHGVDEKTSLAPASITLAEVLKDHGYATLGFVRECIWMNAEFGFDQGFDEYIVKDYFPPEPELNAEYQNKYVERYLRKYKNRKKFIFIHYYDVHSDYRQLPYDAPGQFKDVFYPDYSGSFNGGYGDLVATKYLVHVNNYRIPINDSDVRYIVSLYDGGIAYTDKYIGDFYELLRRMNLYENSLIILTSDHGEEFNEHGRFLHGNNLYYDQTVHIPLIIKLPGQDGGHIAVDEMVESLDIMPFILDLLKIEKKPLMHVQSFLPLINRAGLGKGPVFAFGADKARVSIRDKQWKLAADHMQREEGYRLFDMTEDPLEYHDVKLQHPDVVEKLQRALLSKFSASRRKGGKKEVVLTQRQREKLESLGYIK